MPTWHRGERHWLETWGPPEHDQAAADGAAAMVCASKFDWSAYSRQARVLVTGWECGASRAAGALVATTGGPSLRAVVHRRGLVVFPLKLPLVRR